jgi:hypothetical protein
MSEDLYVLLDAAAESSATAQHVERRRWIIVANLSC